MRSTMILLVALSILLLPGKGFTQTQSNNHQASIQQGGKCWVGNIPVRIKLKNGKNLKGGLLEKTDDVVQVCHKGTSQNIPTNEIAEINTYMTGKQRVEHIGKVLGVITGVFFALGLAFAGARSD